MSQFSPQAESPIDTVMDTIKALSDLKPDFISVTYGAGGKWQGYTFEIADIIKNKYGIDLAHLTCINSKKEDIDCVLKLNSADIENILALRGTFRIKVLTHRKTGI